MKVHTKNHTFRPRCDEKVRADKLHIGYGYKDESHIQIRFEEPDDGVHHNVKEPQIYASVWPNGGSYNARSATVPFKLFVDEFYEFLAHLNARNYEEQEKAKGEDV